MSVIRYWFQRRPLLPNGRLFRWRASMLVQHLRIIQFIQKRHTLGGCSQRKGFTSILQIACKPLLIIKKPLSCGAYILLLAVYFVRHSQFFAALSATRSQYATTISRLHTLTETMLVVSFSVVGLECSFHCVMLFFCLIYISSEWARSATDYAYRPHGLMALAGTFSLFSVICHSLWFN